jgi:hypothetical protein
MGKGTILCYKEHNFICNIYLGLIIIKNTE